MAVSQPVKKNRHRSVPLSEIVRGFWLRVENRLVKINRLEPSLAKRAVLTYRRRVGNVALNGGDAEAARAIALAVKSGGFIKIRRKANGEAVHEKLAV